MEPTGPQPFIVNGESNQKAFWFEMQLLAMRGMERPESLTLEDIRRVCRVTVIGLAKRDESGTFPRSSALDRHRLSVADSMEGNPHAGNESTRQGRTTPDFVPRTGGLVPVEASRRRECLSQKEIILRGLLRPKPLENAGGNVSFRPIQIESSRTTPHPLPLSGRCRPIVDGHG
ncbi:hypothetical protein D3273_22230 [Lichenibacterium minor]|uniref:Uncharacterized protein n=1 Tax=Lichenibacterium minor TaxID=2316528 RepID=A0A4V1RU36_9HYPH|nr:hypothetical protein [Lichenibacterium minor]RYC29784.1 hypothetical protein D3273_22230 [Lichenibacterium minor]